MSHADHVRGHDFPITEARYLAPDVKLFRILAPKIAVKHQAGQFVIVRATDDGERIPLTIAESHPDEGWITLIVQGVGKTTYTLNTFQIGDSVADLVGPLGTPSHIECYGTTAVVGGGVGTAIAYPVAVALKEAGNRVLSIIGGRNRAHVILEEEMRAVSDELYPTTDDGSYGRHGFVTEALQDLLLSDQRLDLVLAVGPIPMMKAVAELTRPHAIRTIASLNPIMVDGTGMCGGCRVSVGGVTRFACVDGPEFDAHEVDFELLTRRNRAYLEFERTKREEFERSRPVVKATGVSDGSA